MFYCSTGTSCSGTLLGLYSIKSGDTLTSIAATCDMALESLLAGNAQIANADEINAGNQLCVPSSCSLAPPAPSPGMLLDFVAPPSVQQSDAR